MKVKKFWKWTNRTVLNQETQEQTQERTLFLNGTIAEESWFDDDVTPQLFKEELMAGERPEHFERIDRAYDDGERMVTTPPYTAYLKIAEGCSNGCAFCIIPKLRGRYRSRTMDHLLEEAKSLADSGVKELIVIAQDITRYGSDLGDGTTLAGLLKELCKLPFHWILSLIHI